MGANDGSVKGFKQLLNNGANNLRYNIVLVSEGYKEAEIPLFQSHCKGFLRKLFWTAPFSSLQCTFNVFALEVSSTDSGIDDPVNCGDGTTGNGDTPATFFDSTLCGGGVRRVISLDSGLVRNRVAGHLPQANAIFVLVNKTFHAGVTGDVVALTTEPGWEDTALHEFGHVLGLADEYECYVCNKADKGRTYDWFDSIRQYGPLDEPNVTDTNSLAGLKWGNMVAATTQVPTPPGSVPPGTVGLFEGAKYYTFGLFRPEQSCAMRTDASVAFCAVCSAAITQALAPWTPTTTCVTPIATPASLTVDARIRRKVMISPGRGGYEVALDTTTNLPAAPTWTYRLDAGAWTALPATRTIQVPINQSLGTYIYNHSAEVRAQVDVGDLDFWVPGTSIFKTAQGTDAIALRQPNNAANVIGNDYGNAANVEGPGYASINFGGLVAGSGWLYVGTRKYYTRLAARLQLDPGYFRPDDNAAWGLQNITWTPTPSQTAGVTALYDVTFDPNGLCWLNSDSATVVDPNVGFPISTKGNDAIGQSFSATGRLIPTNIEYRRSISTIQIPKIPEWEWPMQFDVREKVLEVVFNGVSVKLNESVLQIGKLKAKLQDARK